MSSKLVTNKKDAGKTISNLRINLLPKGVRHDTLEGRPHIVVPMVMLTEGVHAGSGGPLLYNANNMRKTPEIWDHKPVVVYHPQMNGRPMSACKPDILNNRKVGVMLNTRFENGRLKSEAWIERHRADAVDPRIMQAVDSGAMMELSTGLYVDEVANEGEWNGEVYTHEATNFRPDHLALLPDQIGACSIADGAGFLRNNAAQDQEPLLLRDRLVKAGVLRHNELSFSGTREQLRTALRNKFNIPLTADIPSDGPWIEDIYSTFFIYEKAGQLYRLPYEVTETDVTIPAGEEPVEVVRVFEYRTKAGAFVGNKQLETNMNKKQKVDAIIANSKVWKEEHRESLMAMSEDQLGTIEAGETEKEKPATNKSTTPEPKAPAKEEPKKEATPPVANAAAAPAAPARPLTVQEYIDAAPREIADVLTNAKSVYDVQKQDLIQVLTSGDSPPFSAEELQHKPLGELQRLKALMGRQQPGANASAEAQMGVPNYAGRAPVANKASKGEEALDLPTINFDNKGK